jgi:hypothetical protein
MIAATVEDLITRATRQLGVPASEIDQRLFASVMERIESAADVGELVVAITLSVNDLVRDVFWPSEIGRLRVHVQAHCDASERLTAWLMAGGTAYVNVSSVNSGTPARQERLV